MTGTPTEEKGIVMENMRYDVAVVGAGQAGLAIGRALAEQEKRFVILEAAASEGNVDHPAALSRVAVRQHGGADMLVGKRRMMAANIRRIAQDVGGAVFLDGGDRLDALLVRHLHGEQPLFGVAGHIVNVDELMVDVAEQHHIIDVV